MQDYVTRQVPVLLLPSSSMDHEAGLSQSPTSPISHASHISRASSAMDDSQGEKGLPKFVPRSPMHPIQRKGRPARSGTMNSADLRATEGDSVPLSSSHWYSGARIEHPSPDHGDSWEMCDQVAQRMDKGRCDAWKDDVEKMLIFAGLFSAVVTGFTLQAYQMLNVNSASATAQLLAIMAQQELTGTSSANQEKLASIVSGLQHFTPPPYAIRINALWFLSLSFSLTTAIVGILCMQWLREYGRDTSLPHMETFAMSQMRREGLEKWHVPTILSALSLFLQTALLLFFIGLLDFLWHISEATAVAIVVSVFCAITFLFLVATTILPVVQFLLHASYRLRVPQCPYKSPQAWAFCRLGFYFFSLLSYVMPDPKFMFDATANYVTSEWMPWRHRFARGRHALKFASWHHFDKYWYDNRVHQMHSDKSSEVEPDSDFVDGLENLADTLVPESPVFYHLLQCMRYAPLETNKLGPALKRIFGDEHNRIYSALERLSIVQAKDVIGLLSLRYLPDPATRISADAIKSHWELAIRINNTAPDEDTLVEFLPPISLEHVKKVQIPEEIIYQGFTCIGRLAKVDRDLRYGIDNMFVLLVTALARISLDHDRDYEPVLEAMFDTCQHMERWNRQRKAVDMRAVLKCASWFSNAFANPLVDEEVVIRWKQHPDHTKLVSLVRMLDSLWSEDSRKRPVASEVAWASVRRKFLT